VKIRTEPETCQGTGFCAQVAPAVFSQDDAGTVVLLDAAPPAAEREVALEAEAMCPANAIWIDS
jgi:ferredoxin